VPEAARFCPFCGNAILLGRTEERRVVSVLFADLVGFTAMAESLDPEQVKHLVDGCFELLVADIVAYGGRVDKIVGDAIVALFGAPVAHEDDAERAVRAALRMQGTVGVYAVARKVPFQVRIGVNTGEVLVGALRAGGDYTAMGDVVNAAERLQTSAQPGAVLVGRSTYSATQRVVRYEAVGPVRVRNREEPVDAWRAIEPLAPPGRRGRKVKAPFVGRDTELALLLDGTRLAVTHHRPFLAAIEGEGGVGKSRLAREAITRAREAFAPVVLVARCMPYGESSPWHPLSAALAEQIGLEAGSAYTDAEQTVCAALEALGEAVVDNDHSRIATGLLHLFGQPTALDGIDPARARDELTHAVLVYLHALARRGPVLLAVADLEWADPLLLELLERALGESAGLSFVLFTTSRPNTDAPWPPPPGRHNTLALRVDALDPLAARELATALLDDAVDDATRGAVLERGGGNPLFLEELAAAVTDCGVVTELPDTLRGLVSARLDLLDPAARALLDNAAVLGPSGKWDALVTFGEKLGQSPHPDSLATLADAELLDVDGDRWSFRSESVRDVAYQTLTKSARAQRHFGVAKAIEEATHGSDLAAERIAHHYASAARLVDELGPVQHVDPDVAVDAASWFARAAARALDRMVPRKAAQLVDEGLAVLGPDDVDGEIGRQLLQLRGRAYVELHQMEAARRDAIVVLEGARRAGDRAAMAEAHGILGEIHTQTGRLDRANTSFAQAVELWRDVGDRRGEAEAQRAWGFASVLGGDFDDAERHLAAAHEVFAAENDRRGQAWVDQHRAWISFVQSDMAQAEERLNHAASTFIEMGDRGGLAWVHGLLAFVRFNQGRFEEADTLAREVIDDSLHRDEPWGRGMMLALQSALRLWAGRLPEAVTLGEESKALMHSIGDRYGETQAIAPLSRALVATGRVADANRVIEEARTASELYGLAGYSGTIAAGAAVHAGDGERAAREARHALDELRQHHVEGYGYDAGVTLGLALLQTGFVEEADEVLATARLERPGHPNALAVSALVALAAGRCDEARGYAETARAAAGGTYLDLVLALVALGLAEAERGGGDACTAALHEAITLADGAGDLVMQAVTRLAAAEAGLTLGRPGAADDRVAAEARLDALALGTDGWITAIGLAARGGERIPIG
jgi:class 3 adenylate cyclase/tetratricopeptide (TPR) repeat protein